MKAVVAVIFAALLILLAVLAFAPADTRSPVRQNAVLSVPSGSAVPKRDPRGRIKRSASSRREFRTTHPCPSTGKTRGACADHVIDHIVPLACGGEDAAANMQWQTAADAR